LELPVILVSLLLRGAMLPQNKERNKANRQPHHIDEREEWIPGEEAER